MNDVRHSSEKMSASRGGSRISGQTSNNKRKPARSASGGKSGNGRRTVECLLADNLKNSSNGIIQH